MTSYHLAHRKLQKFIDGLLEFAGGNQHLDRHLVEKIVIYAESLLSTDSKEIDERTYTNQMSMQFGMTNAFMISLIFNAMRSPGKIQNKSLTVEEFSKLICIYMTSNIELKADFAFNVYDADKDGAIIRAEVYTMLKTTMILEDEEQEEILKDLTDIVMRAADSDSSGTIERREYKALVRKNRLYLEMLGQCLPEDKDVLRFKNKLRNKSTLEVKELFDSEMKQMAIRGEIKEPRDNYYPIKLTF